jgi:hypothetical protein
MDRPRAASVGGLHSPLIAVSAMAPFTLNGDVGDELGACEMVLDIIGDLLTRTSAQASRF